MVKQLTQLIADAVTVQDETAAGANTAARIGSLFASILLGLGFKYDPTSEYQPGQIMFYKGRLFEAFQVVTAGETPDVAPGKWIDSAATDHDQISDRADKLVTARIVGDYIEGRVTELVNEPGKLNLTPADELTAGIAPRASQAKVLAGTDNEAFVTAKGLAYALAEAFRGLDNYGWNDSTKIDPTTDSEITVDNRANVKSLRLIDSLQAVERKDVNGLLVRLANGLIAETPISALSPMSVTASYDEDTRILTLTTANNVGQVTFNIPLLKVEDSTATTYTVPAELRSGSVKLAITAQTDSQLARASIQIPADPLGNFYIYAAYVARNVGADGISSVSHFVKAKGQGIFLTVTGLNGTVLPAAIDGVRRKMTNEGYQRPGLFVGVAEFAGLDVNCGNGFYRVKYEMQDHDDITLTLEYQISDSQPQIVLYESTIKPPEEKPEAPALNSVVITTGKDFSVSFPPFKNAPTGSIYSLNYRPNGATFNSSNRTLSGNVGAGNEMAEKDVQYVINTPSGSSYSVTFKLSVVSETTPGIKKAIGFFNDDDPSVPSFVAHSIVMQTVGQPAGTVPQTGTQVIINGNPEQIFWKNCVALNDGSEYNFKEARQVGSFGNAGLRVKYYIRFTSTSPEVLLYDRDIQDTPANREQAIIYYPTISSGGGNGTTTQLLDDNLGAEVAWTNQTFVGFNSNPNRLNVRAVINENDKVDFFNDGETPAPGHFYTYLLDGYGNDGSTHGSTKLEDCDEAERGVTHHILCHIIKDGTPPDFWTNQNYQLEESCEMLITVY